MENTVYSICDNACSSLDAVWSTSYATYEAAEQALETYIADTLKDARERYLASPDDYEDYENVEAYLAAIEEEQRGNLEIFEDENWFSRGNRLAK